MVNSHEVMIAREPFLCAFNPLTYPNVQALFNGVGFPIVVEIIKAYFDGYSAAYHGDGSEGHQRRGPALHADVHEGCERGGARGAKPGCLLHVNG